MAADKVKQYRGINAMLIVCIIIALAFAFPEAAKYRSLRDECTEVTEGTVIDIDSYRSGRKRSTTYYRLDVMYYVRGQSYSVITGPSSSKAKIGDRVTVNYAPDKPVTAYVEGRVEKGASGFAAAGTFLLFLIVNTVSHTVKKKNDENDITG